MLYLTALQEGLLYGLLALGVYISLRVLDIPDLTTEGSFGFGSALAAVLAAGGHTYLSLPIAFLGGMAAGLITGLLQTKLQVHPVLAGIITMSGLYSVNLIVRGGPNLSIGAANLFKQFYKALHLTGDQRKVAGALLALAICLVVTLLLIVFFKTHVGLCIRATGDNQDMVRASSINTAFTITVGLCVSNAMTSLSGAVLAQYQKSADINLGTGMVVIGLASLIIGETLFGRGGMWVKAASAVAGSVIYRFIIAIALRANVPSECLKLISAIIVALAIAAPSLKKNLTMYRRRTAARQGRGRDHA